MSISINLRTCISEKYSNDYVFSTVLPGVAQELNNSLVAREKLFIKVVIYTHYEYEYK